LQDADEFLRLKEENESLKARLMSTDLSSSQLAEKGDAVLSSSEISALSEPTSATLVKPMADMTALKPEGEVCTKSM
jgi:hypothetical protein